MRQIEDKDKTIDAQKGPVRILSGHRTRPVFETNFDLLRYSKKRKRSDEKSPHTFSAVYALYCLSK